MQETKFHYHHQKCISKDAKQVRSKKLGNK